MSDQALTEESFGLLGDEASRAAAAQQQQQQQAQQQQLKLGLVASALWSVHLAKHFIKTAIHLSVVPSHRSVTQRCGARLRFQGLESAEIKHSTQCRVTSASPSVGLPPPFLTTLFSDDKQVWGPSLFRCQSESLEQSPLAVKTATFLNHSLKNYSRPTVVTSLTFVTLCTLL